MCEADREGSCCFLGHRKICETEQLKRQLRMTIEQLIEREGINTFLFGSKSRFNDLCYELVTEIKGKHPHIRRVYVRAEYPNIGDRYRAYLLKSYEQTYYPKKIMNAGKAVYIERNYEMIRQSRVCIIYYDEAAVHNKSGTKASLAYAKRLHKEIVRFPMLEG